MGAAAVAVIILKERQLVDHFRQHGALSPNTAKSESEIGVEQNVAWKRLVRRAIVRQTSNGLFYLDEQSWTARESLRRRMAVVTLLIVLLASALVILVPIIARR